MTVLSTSTSNTNPNRNRTITKPVTKPAPAPTAPTAPAPMQATIGDVRCRLDSQGGLRDYHVTRWGQQFVVETYINPSYTETCVEEAGLIVDEIEIEDTPLGRTTIAYVSYPAPKFSPNQRVIVDDPDQGLYNTEGVIDDSQWWYDQGDDAYMVNFPSIDDTYIVAAATIMPADIEPYNWQDLPDDDRGPSASQYARAYGGHLK